MNSPRSRHALAQTHVWLGLVLLGLAMWAGWPRARMLYLQSLRAEVPYMVDALASALHAAEARRQPVASLGPTPRHPDDLDATPVSWTANWPDTGTPPMTSVRGTYSVVSTAEGFRVVGRCDVDEDGVDAVYIATQDSPATAETDADIY